jgi:hydroxymethylbilane synthase
MNGVPPLRLGTRRSLLARTQSQWVADRIEKAAADAGHAVRVELVDVVTHGDTSSAPLASFGGVGVFVSRLREVLLAGEVDLAVHSAKDLPGKLPDGLALAGVPGREDPRDAFLGQAGSVDELPDGARIGTSSLRRRSQLLALRPDLDVLELRGNVDTRLGRLADGDFDGIVLAAAGLARLGRLGEASFCFELDEMTPAGGQGCLAIEARADDKAATDAAGQVTDRAALSELAAERAAVAALEADCDSAVGICARHGAEGLVVRGYAGAPDGGDWVRDRVAGDADQPVALGEALAERMLAAGAAEILEASRA